MSETKWNGNIIETLGLSKHYGKVKAVEGVSLNVKKGEIYGFLGLNGAGKTTTIRMLLGMIRPLKGETKLLGMPIIPGRPGPWDRVGYLVELPYSYPELTVRENLTAISSLRRLNQQNAVSEIIGQLKLQAYAHIKARHLSLGNSQRLGLAKALIHKPEVLILDEPSNGLDPAGIVEIRERLKILAKDNGVTIFISSHNLDEISRIASRIGIIHNGVLIQEIDTDKLESELHKTLLIDTRDRKGAAAFLTDKSFTVDYTDEGVLRIADPGACEKPETINSLLVSAGFPPFYLKTDQEDLEAYFLRIIGEK